MAQIANISFPPTHPLFHLALGLVVSITVGILEREVAVNDPLWPKCGADCCQWVVNNHWLYWQPALLPGGLWQHFSSIPTFLLPRALQCFHPEVNIDEVTLSTLSPQLWQKCTIGMCTIWPDICITRALFALPVFTTSKWGNFGQALVPTSAAL